MSASSESKKILLVDDELEFAGGIIASLRVEGYEIQTADDYDDAIQQLSNTIFDIIILDLLIPPSEVEESHQELDMIEVGIKLYKYIREDLQIEQTPIIFLSVVRDAEIIKNLLKNEKKFNHDLNQLAKPARPSEVVKMVNKVYETAMN